MFAAVKKLFTHQYDNNGVQSLIDSERTAVNTPDVLLLEQKENHLVFLYCDRQLRHPRAIDQSVHVWDGFSQKDFLLWKHEMGKESHPIAMHRSDVFRRLPQYPVRGEVVRMRTERLVQLDQERQNRVQFKRVRAPIVIKTDWLTLVKDPVTMEAIHGTPRLRGDHYPIPCEHVIEAWMYVGIAKYWTPLLDNGYLFSSGKLIEPKNNKNAKYFFFPPTSYPT